MKHLALILVFLTASLGAFAQTTNTFDWVRIKRGLALPLNAGANSITNLNSISGVDATFTGTLTAKLAVFETTTNMFLSVTNLTLQGTANANGFTFTNMVAATESSSPVVLAQMLATNSASIALLTNGAVTLNSSLVVNGGVTALNSVNVTGRLIIAENVNDLVIGSGAVTNMWPGSHQITIGNNTIGGYESIMIGYLAGNQTVPYRSLSIGNVTGAAQDATFLGNGAGGNTLGGPSASVMIGKDAGNFSTHAIESVIVGSSAGLRSVNSSNSVFIGTGSGLAATNADHSVYIGDRCGYWLNKANVLQIETILEYATNVTGTGLIYGEFDTRILIFNATNHVKVTGDLIVSNNLTSSGLAIKTAITTTNYLYGKRDYMVFANAANITNTLPLASANKDRIYGCKSLVTNIVAIVPQPGDAIDWDTILTIGTKGTTIEFISDGTTNWFVK